MPLPIAPPDSALCRFYFVVAGVPVRCRPTGPAKLTGTPGPASDSAAAFFLRDAMSGPLVFAGDDYTLLRGIETSSTPCLPIGLVMELRPHEYAPFASHWQGLFTCREQGSVWDVDNGTFAVSPTTDDAYRLLLENWDAEINLLQMPSIRTQVTAQLATLAAGTFVEFLRKDTADQADFVGIDGWTLFLTNTSFISGSRNVSGTFDNPDSTRAHDAILFRYRLVGVPMIPPVAPATAYVAVDKSGSGWQILIGSENGTTTPHRVDYVKTPGIAGFRPYKIGTYNDWNDPLNPPRTNRYGDQLLLLPCFESPADHGFDNAAYLKVTGIHQIGQSLGGAFNAEADGNDPGGHCLNVRRTLLQGSQLPANSKSLWWRFGDFKFGRCFPLAEALRFALQRAAVPLINNVPQPAIPAILALVPDTVQQLSAFYTAATNPATGDTGAANEVPGLLLSAASDVKRYGASEAATRLMISPKTLISEACTLHDLGWFIDPITGKFRIEHHVYAETQYGNGPVIDLTAAAGAILPATYTTRQAQAPRYEELTIASAQTVDAAGYQGHEVNFASGLLDYGAVGFCVDNRPGSNRTTRGVSRLTGDVAACVLSGDAIPDNALVVLAPDALARLSDANRALSASRLMQRYHRHGRAALLATINGLPTVLASLRPQREQTAQSVPLPSVPGGFPDTGAYTTRLGTKGQLIKRELDPRTGTVTLAFWVPAPTSTTPARLPSRQFDGSFNPSFH